MKYSVGILGTRWSLISTQDYPKFEVFLRRPKLNAFIHINSRFRFILGRGGDGLDISSCIDEMVKIKWALQILCLADKNAGFCPLNGDFEKSNERRIALKWPKRGIAWDSGWDLRPFLFLDFTLGCIHVFELSTYGFITESPNDRLYRS